MIVKFFLCALLLSVLKGQKEHNDVLKRHLIMILILGRIFYNYISTINYVCNWCKWKMNFIN